VHAVDPARHPLLRDIDPEVTRALLAASFHRVVPRRATLHRRSDAEPSLVLVLAGSAQLFSSTAEGEELMLALLRAPGSLGEAECLLGAAAQTDGRALERCVVLEIERAAVTRALATCPRFSANFARAIADKLRCAEARQLALAFEPVEARLARLLVEYAEAYGLPVEDGIKIRLPLCQDQLASALGVARRSVTRALKGWTDDGIVAKRAAHYVISDLRPLRAAAGVDAVALAR
jgi:CRP/FNR family cyclic AMP-dependent transcriptional regulator